MSTQSWLNTDYLLIPFMDLITIFERILENTMLIHRKEADKFSTSITKLHDNLQSPQIISSINVEKMANIKMELITKLKILSERGKEINNMVHALSFIQAKLDKIQFQDTKLIPQTSMIDNKDRLEKLAFGYIRLLIENKHKKMNIPSYLKTICFEYYGNIQMNSKILNVNEMNIIAYILKEKLNDKIKYFEPKLIYTSNENEFDRKNVEEKLKYDTSNNFIVIKTNDNHVYGTFNSLKICKQRFDDFGCFLRNTFNNTIPIIWKKEWKQTVHDIYHFPNDFEV